VVSAGHTGHLHSLALYTVLYINFEFILINTTADWYRWYAVWISER